MVKVGQGEAGGSVPEAGLGGPTGDCLTDTLSIGKFDPTQFPPGKIPPIHFPASGILLGGILNLRDFFGGKIETIS